MKNPQGFFDFNQPSFRGTIQEKFEAFHALNPRVYQHLVRMTRQLKDRGRSKMGIGMLFEVLRWEYYMTTEDTTSEFKLSNSYRSRYARLIMKQEPDLAGIFNTKELRSE